MMVSTFSSPATTPGVVAGLFPPLKQVRERSCSLPEAPPQPPPTPLFLPDRRRWRLSSRTDQTPPTQIDPIHSVPDPVSPHPIRLAGIDLAGVIASDPFWVSHCAAHHCQAPVHARLALAAAIMPDPDPNSRTEPTLKKPDRRCCTVGGESGYFWQKVQVGPWTFPDLTEVPDLEFCAKSAPKVGFGWFWFRDGFLKGGTTNDLDSKALQTGRGRAKLKTRQDPTSIEELLAVEELTQEELGQYWRKVQTRAWIFPILTDGPETEVCCIFALDAEFWLKEQLGPWSLMVRAEAQKDRICVKFALVAIHMRGWFANPMFHWCGWYWYRDGFDIGVAGDCW